MNSLLDAALRYAQYGWYVFPLVPQSKRPLTENGLHDATTDRAVIEAWWVQWPTANIGIATGQSQLVVVDVDPKNGGTLAGLESIFDGQVPPTRRAETGGGGWHLYFKQAPGDAPVKNSVNLLGPGIDTRGQGGYVVAPPSQHESGKAYAWASQDGFLLFPHKQAEQLRFRPRDAQLTSAGDGEKISSGRNNLLTSLAGRLRLAGFEYEELLPAIHACNMNRCDPPLDDDEVDRIARGITRYAPGPGIEIAKREAALAAQRPPKRPPTPTPVQQVDVALQQPLAVPDGLKTDTPEFEILAALLAESQFPPDLQQNLLGHIASVVLPTDFHVEAYRQVYQAICDIDSEHGVISLPSIDAKLRGKPGYAGLDTIKTWGNASTRQDILFLSSLAAEVLDASKKRRLLWAGQRLESEDFSALSAADIAARYEEVMREIGFHPVREEDEIGTHADAYERKLDDWWTNGTALRGTDFGLACVNDVTSGMEGGDLWVLAARASVGKTAMALTTALNAAKQAAPGHGVGMISLEMSGVMLFHRLVAMESGFGAHDIKVGGPGVDRDHVYECIRRVRALPLYIMDATTAIKKTNGARGVITPTEIRNRVASWRREVTLDLVIVDYLELIKPPDERRRDSREQQIAECVTQMKHLAFETNLPVLLLAQCSREVEKRGTKLPTLADLRYSAEIEHYSDVVLLLFRQDYYTQRGISVALDQAREPGVTDIIVAKNRNGPVCMLQCYFDQQAMRYWDLHQTYRSPITQAGTPAPVTAQPVAMPAAARPLSGGMVVIDADDTPPVSPPHSLRSHEQDRRRARQPVFPEFVPTDDDDDA